MVFPEPFGTLVTDDQDSGCGRETLNTLKKALLHMKTAFRNNGTTISLRRKYIGSISDPYTRETLTVERLGHQYQLESCALSGVTYFKDGKRIDKTGTCYGREEAERVVERFAQDAGATHEQFEKWYWERVYQHDPMDDAIIGWQ